MARASGKAHARAQDKVGPRIGPYLSPGDQVQLPTPPILEAHPDAVAAYRIAG